MSALSALIRYSPRLLTTLCLAVPLASTLMIPIQPDQNQAWARYRRKAKSVKKVPPQVNKTEPEKLTVEPELLAADQLMRKGRFSDAESLYYQVLKQNPESLPARVGYGLALARQFKLAAARSQLEKVLETHKGNAMAHAGLAIVLYNSLQSSDPDIRANRNKIIAQAEEECRKALAIEAQMPEAQYTLGNLYRTQGSMDKALKAYETAADIDPNYSEALSGIGLVKLSKDELKQAEVSFKRAIDANAKNSTAHYGLGKTYYKLGNLKNALKELNTSLDLHGESAPGHLARARVHNGLGEFEKAQQDFKEVLGITPRSKGAYLGLAAVKENQEQITAAIEELEKGLEAMPKEDSIEARQALLFLKQGKLAPALKHYLALLSRSPQNKKAVWGIATVLYLRSVSDSQGDYQDSDEFTRAKNLVLKAASNKKEDALFANAGTIVNTISGDKSGTPSLKEDGSYLNKFSYYQALLATGKFQESEKALAQMIQETNEVDSLMEIADLSLVLRDLKNAKAAYEKAGDSKNPEAYAGRIKRGLALIEDSLEISRKETRKASDLVKKKELEEALKSYRIALLRDPRSPETRLGLAELLEKKRPYKSRVMKEAARHYSAYLALSPDLKAKEIKSIKKKRDKLETKAGKLAIKESASKRSKKDNS